MSIKIQHKIKEKKQHKLKMLEYTSICVQSVSNCESKLILQVWYYGIETLQVHLSSTQALQDAPPGWLSGERVGRMTWWL